MNELEYMPYFRDDVEEVVCVVIAPRDWLGWFRTWWDIEDLEEPRQ
jgi:hypothetical protein